MNSLSCKDTLQELVAFIVKFSVELCTQPAAFNDVFVYTPLEVYIAPLDVHVNELQAVCDKVDVELLLTTRFNVVVFAQPETFNEVIVYTPLAVYVKPFAPQVYESQEVSVKVDDEPLFVF